MTNPRKEASNPSKNVSSSTIKTKDNQIEKAPLLNGNFHLWKARMKNFLMAQDFEVWESVVTKSTMEEESKEYNARVIKSILSGLPDPINVKVVKCSSTKGTWEKL